PTTSPPTPTLFPYTTLFRSGPPDLVQLLDHVDRDADRAGFVRQGPGDRLPDPPSRIGGELEALAVVELLRGAHQAKRPLLNQIEIGRAHVTVVLGDGDHEPEIRLHHLLLGVEIAALDPLREIDLLLCGEQTHLADVLQEQLKGIGRYVRLEVERRL